MPNRMQSLTKGQYAGWFWWLWLLMYAVLPGCTGTPEGVEPITGFDQERYLGRWYEIARLDHSFERGLRAVTADYSLREDGEIRVVNRGLDSESGDWEVAEGRARFVGERDIGHLEVSFFGPFYSSYIIFELGDDYDYAFVAGYNTNYLWLLARTPVVSETLRARFTRRIETLGFNPEALIWPEATVVP